MKTAINPYGLEGTLSTAQVIGRGQEYDLRCVYPGFYGSEVCCMSVKRTWSPHALKLNRIAMLKHIVIINLQFYLHKLKSIWISLNFAGVSTAPTGFDFSENLP